MGKTPRYGGNLAITPRARLDQPYFEICLIPSVHRLRYLKLLPFAMFGGIPESMKGVSFLRASTARATGDGVLVQIDGELIGFFAGFIMVNGLHADRRQHHLKIWVRHHGTDSLMCSSSVEAESAFTVVIGTAPIWPLLLPRRNAIPHGPDYNKLISVRRFSFSAPQHIFTSPRRNQDTKKLRFKIYELLIDWKIQPAQP